MLLIQQYRHPSARATGRSRPGCSTSAGEAPLAAAQRELAEEADLAAERPGTCWPTSRPPGGSDETIRVYLARGIASAVPAFARHDEEADIEMRWVPLDEAVDAVLDAPRAEPVADHRGARRRARARASGWATLGARRRALARTRALGAGSREAQHRRRARIATA